MLGVPEAGVLGCVTEEQLKVDMEETGRPEASWEALLRNCLFSTEREDGLGLIRAFTPPAAFLGSEPWCPCVVA